MVEVERVEGEVVFVQGWWLWGGMGMGREEWACERERVLDGEVVKRRTRVGGRLASLAAARAVGLVSGVQKRSLAWTWESWVASSLGVEPGLEEEKIPPAAMVE